VGQVKLDLLDEVAEIVNMLAHCSLSRLLEVMELFLMHAEFRIAPCTVLRDKLLPGVGGRLTPNDTGVCGAV